MNEKEFSKDRELEEKLVLISHYLDHAVDYFIKCNGMYNSSDLECFFNELGKINKE